MRFVVADTSGLLDALVPFGCDPVEWLAGWVGGRSTLALDTAAALIRRSENMDLI